LGCDAYELLMCKLGKPYLNIIHMIPYLVLTILNRIIVISFLCYTLAKFGSAGDMLFLPLIAIISGILILVIRVVNSDKAAACLSRIRG
jgi:hypothetical protein